MAAFIVYLFIAGIIVYFISRRTRPVSFRTVKALPRETQRKGPGFKAGPQEVWKQVYETASMEEARLIQTRLEEEGVECILYEQGKKDIHGDLLKGVGVAVPSVAVSQAQATIAKMPV